MVGLLLHVLDALFNEEGYGLGVEVGVDPGGNFPVFFWDELCEEVKCVSWELLNSFESPFAYHIVLPLL